MFLFIYLYKFSLVEISAVFLLLVDFNVVIGDILGVYSEFWLCAVLVANFSKCSIVEISVLVLCFLVDSDMVGVRF